MFFLQWSSLEIEDLFFRCAPPQYVMHPPVTEHVPFHSKSSCKNMACASGGGVQILGRGTNGKDPKQDF